jgi:hypothetical protein
MQLRHTTFLAALTAILACDEPQPDSNDDAGACPRVTWFASSPGEPFMATVLPFEVLCEFMSCPADLDTLLAELEAENAQVCGRRKVSGCGVVSVYQDYPNPILTWHFNAETGALIGASRMDDTYYEVGGCRDAVFQAGEGTGSCDQRTTEQLCNDAGI